MLSLFGAIHISDESMVQEMWHRSPRCGMCGEHIWEPSDAELVYTNQRSGLVHRVGCSEGEVEGFNYRMAS